MDSRVGAHSSQRPAIAVLVLAMAWLARMLAHGRIGSSLSARDRNAAVQNLRGVQVFVASLGGVMVWLQGHTAAANSGLVGSVIAYVLVGVMIAWLVIMTVRRARE